ncbi:5-amino-6-(5-phosphoribosylamino)uracil reductase [Sinosporangium album]|uniref:5-amino-6-(5-phosphoribosylamino)uracil reductase n=2 Tax=Sinosporangium album TaxID=504805 RepID=A0A1G7TF26_9ACTN|nr:dihydrofolate reductase family protein [Sinosporangium album]SDG33712.1 5-amino-6-(5-phosphoribosylamino)uracil reductase [Sinosporangium album]
MDGRPYVLLSCAMSLDGHIDDSGPDRLLLSNEEDFDRVDEVRASCDAILVGAGTLRRDNPRLLVRSEARRHARVRRGLPPHPAKVTLTATARLDPAGLFFTEGDARKIVYAASAVVGPLSAALAGVAEVSDAGDPLDLRTALADLARRGIARLMVEGGGTVHTHFLQEGLVDELQLVVAPFFVGDPSAPRFVYGGSFPQDSRHRMELADVRRLGDVVLLRYLVGGA